jgi:two-component system chemotaxis response regulator CheY
MRKLLKGLLAQFGSYPVAEASNGAEALDFMAANDTCLVISDLHMQPIDGVELLRTVRAQREWAELPFILISGDQTPAAISTAVSAGASAILAKPFGRDQLAQHVSRSLPSTWH